MYLLENHAGHPFAIEAETEQEAKLKLCERLGNDPFDPETGIGAVKVIDEGEDGQRPGADTEERKCRVCGCTQDRACPGGCYWVKSDLCSACEDTEEAKCNQALGGA